MADPKNTKWLLFFYSLPANPVNNRVKIWRKLMKTGAVQLKGGVYILPRSEDNHEALQWLLAELPNLKGEGLLVTTETIEPWQDQEIITLFDHQRQVQYRDLAEKVETFSGRLRNLRKGGRDKKATSLFRQYEKLQADFQTVQRRDFFCSKAGRDLAMRLQAIKGQLEELAAIAKNPKSSIAAVLPGGRHLANFAQLTWLTRKRPFVDRMASAWLIRRFIDPKAIFAFRDEAELTALNGKDEISFDVRNGDFTHIDDLCTFEVLLQSFGLTAPGLDVLAGIVHDIDIKDRKFAAPEAHVVEMIIKGIRNRGMPDSETLDQGMAIFEALYLAMIDRLQPREIPPQTFPVVG